MLLEQLLVDILFFLLSCQRFLHKNPEDPSEVPGGFITDINPDSMREISGAMLERSVSGSPPLTRYQFERVGYFCVDFDSSKGKVSGGGEC